MNRIPLHVLAALCAAVAAHAQNFTFSTLAGHAGASGLVDATGDSARFNQPLATAVDADGNVYVGELNNATLRKITPAGAVSTLAVLASGAAGLAVDAGKNVFVADAASHVIRKVTPAGAVSVFAGQAGSAGSADGPGTAARFNAPDSIAIDGAGNLFVTDAGSHTIRRITPAGAVSTFAGLAGLSGYSDGAATSARFSSPAGIAVDASGTVYVADAGNRVIRKITSGGAVTSLAGYAYSSGNTDGTGSSATFGRPQGIAFDATGALIVCDQINHTLRRVTTAGVVTTIAGAAGTAGSADGSGVNARFNSPDGIAVDAIGTLYIADSANHTIRKGTFLPPPVISTQPANQTAVVGQNAAFTIVATSGQPIIYQWQRRAANGTSFVALTEGNGYTGTTTATLTVGSVTLAMSGDQFRCVVENGSGSTVTSQAAALSVNSPPVITSANSGMFFVGVNSSFTITATGAPAPTFSISSGALPAWAALNSVSGSISGVAPSTSGSPYTFTISASNGVGTAATQSFTLTVQPAPVAPTVTINSSSARLVGPVGSTLLLSGNATGTEPMSFQWKRNGLPIAGATSLLLSRSNMQFRDGGYYQLVATNAAGTKTSPAVFVHVVPSKTEVFAWGSNNGGEMNVPAGLDSMVAVAAGNSHAMALRSNGTVVNWGSAVASPPAGLTEVVAIAAGEYHEVALKADGTVVAWGGSGSGTAFSPPAELSNVVAISAGRGYSLALKGDGTVVMWGSNSTSLTPPAGLSGVVAISAGYYHALALLADGQVVSWGNTTYVPSSVQNVIAVAAGSDTSIAAKADGTVAVWGSSSWGLGSIPAGLANVTNVALSFYQAVALKSDGRIVVWGDNYNVTVPNPPAVAGVLAIAAGAGVKLGLRDSSNDLAPTIVTSPASVAANQGQRVTFSVSATAGTAALNYQWYRNGTLITGATDSTYAVDNVTSDNAGQYYVIASNALGSATSSAATLSINAAPMVNAFSGGRYSLVAGESLTLSLASSISAGASVQWRRNGQPIAGATSRSYTIASATLAKSGYYQAIYNDGSGAVTSAAVFVSVMPARTQVLAFGASSSSSEANVPAGLNNVIAVSTRGSTTIALRADGTVAQWGTYSSYNPPAGLGNLVAVAAGSSAFYGLKGDGTVTAWGDTYYSSQWAPPGGLTNVVAIASGFGHALALKGDGTVVAWGNTTSGATAVPAGLGNVVAVAAGSAFSMALRADGTVVAWGSNNVGQSAVPAGLSGVVAIAAGSTFAIALKSNGTVVTWGSLQSSYGSLTPPAGLANVVGVAAGDSHALALKTDGSVEVWGVFGYSGGVVPILARQVFAMSGGNAVSVVVRDASADVVPVISAQPAPVAAFTGQTVTFGVTAGGGTSTLAYQWRKGGVAIAGATNFTLVLNNVTTDQAANYDVVVSNYLGAVSSQTAVLTVNAAAAVTTTPTGRQMITAGQSLTLNSAVAMPGPVTYQWWRDGQPINGATASSYIINNATWRRGGVYQLVAKNSVGPARSAPIFLGVAGNVQLKTWGDNSAGQTAIPAGLANVIHAAAGSNHSLALKSDGTVVAWGGNTSGQSNVPSDIGDAVAIAAGNNFSAALIATGAVRTWGVINFTPTEVGTATAIAASPTTSDSYVLALRADGTVVEWSSSGLRTNLPTELSDVVAIAAGPGNRLALRGDGTIVQWGYYSGSTVLLDAPGVVAIASGNSHILGLRADGTVVAWGSGYWGQATVPVGLSGVAAIYANGDSSYAIKNDGTVVAWGYTTSLTPAAVALAPAYEFSFGNNHGIGLRDASTDAAPVITTQPVAQTATAGQAVTLSVVATGLPPPAYQWFKNGVALAGATTSALKFSYVSTSDAGNYSVTVSNELGSLTSNEIALVINPSIDQRGLLASTAHASTGPVVITGTFTVEAAGSKQVLVRGVGPALTTFGITGVLADPQIEITTAGGVLVASNDNWGSAANSAQIQSASLQAGAFALAMGSKDAAVLRQYSPGTYHVRLTGVGGTAGVAMLDIYDADSTPRLVYVATAAFAGVGGDAFIQGFGLAGATTGRSYLVRALGPTLGGPGALADPELLIFNSANAQVATNDNWGGDAGLAAMAATVGAMPLAAASKDAAVKFEPATGGAYTVQVRGVSGATGRVLVEIFEVDAQRAAIIPPAIVAAPQSRAVIAGQPVDFAVVALGRPAPTFQWKKNGAAISGATDASLALANAQSTDAGDYTVLVTNSAGTLSSAPATLTLVTHSGTQAVVGHGYVAGGTVRITNILTYTGAAASLGWQVTLPAGWSYAGGSGAEGDVKPAVGATGTLSWAWSTPPASPVTFSYTLNVPSSETTVRTLAASAILRAGADPETAPVSPGPLNVPPAPNVHSADTRGATTGTPPDRRIDLFELTRVIELYNTRNGTVRTGCYDVQAGTEDGFASVPTRAGGTVATLASYHSADSNRDGALSLFELTRVIELYNTRSGTTRTGEYHSQGGTEDSFAPGP